MVDEDKAKICAGCCGVLYLASIIMVGCAFSTLGPLDAGIEMNTATKSIDATRVYTSGRYFLGLGRAFLQFPRNFQTIEYSSSADADEPPLTARTNAGQITLDCSLQYTLVLENLVDIYQTYELTYHSKFVKIAQNRIKLIASTFEPQAFYTQRKEVTKQMFAALVKDLATENVVVHDFQLRKVTLPSANENKIIDKLIAAERQRTAQNQQQENEIVAQTTVISGEQDRLIRIFTANKMREATIVTQNSVAQAKAISLSSQTKVFNVLKSDLGLSSPQLMKYLWLKQLRDVPSTATMAIGFKDATVKVSTR